MIRRGRFLAFVLMVSFVAGGCGRAPGDQEPAAGAVGDLVATAQLYTFTVAQAAGGWSEAVEVIQDRVVPKLEVQGGRIYGLWHPLELDEEAPFDGLSPDELIFIVAWPRTGLGDATGVVDATLGALPEVTSVQTRIIESVVLPHGPEVSSGPGFYVIRSNHYRVEDVARAVQLSEEAWVTFEPVLGAEIVGLFRERPDEAGLAYLTRIVWYPSYEGWQDSREFTRDPESLERFAARRELEIDGVGVAAGLFTR